jgi:hypothetical protein
LHDPVSCRNHQAAANELRNELSPRPSGVARWSDERLGKGRKSSGSRHRFAGARERHREVAERRVKITWGGRRGEAAGSPGNELDHHFSARTISWRSETSAPRRSSGQPEERRGRPWPGGTYAAALRASPASESLGLCVKCLDSSCEESVSPLVSTTMGTQPQQPSRGSGGTARSGLQLGSTAHLHGWADDNASCQVPESFVVC